MRQHIDDTNRFDKKLLYAGGSREAVGARAEGYKMWLALKGKSGSTKPMPPRVDWAEFPKCDAFLLLESEELERDDKASFF